jgi:hypothetical protein
MWFHAATVLEAMLGSLFVLPLLNTATVVYLNRTEGAHAPRAAAEPSAAPLSDAGR